MATSLQGFRLVCICSLVILGQCSSVTQEGRQSFIRLCSVDDVTRLDNSINSINESVKKLSSLSAKDDSLAGLISQLDEIHQKMGLIEELKRDAWDLRTWIQAQSAELNLLYRKLNSVNAKNDVILNAVQSIQSGLNFTSAQEHTKSVLVDPVTEACYNFGHGFAPIECRWCVAIFVRQKSWSDALEDCERLNATLLKIDSAGKQRAVTNWLVSHSLHNQWGRYWAGGHSVNDQWKWAADEEDFVYTHWSDGQPSHYEEECLDLVADLDYKWNDMNCLHEQQYICEKSFL